MVKLECLFDYFVTNLESFLLERKKERKKEMHLNSQIAKTRIDQPLFFLILRGRADN